MTYVLGKLGLVPYKLAIELADTYKIQYVTCTVPNLNVMN